MELPQFPSRPACTLCELHAHTPPSGVNGVPTCYFPSSLPPNPTTPSLVFIGMNPGREESIKNEPFVGPSGNIVRNVYIPGAGLQELGSIYFTNTARCYSPILNDTNMIADRHYKACRSFLLPDLLSLPGRPLHLICLGADPVSHLCALAGLGKKTQKWSFSHQGEVFDLPTVGPFHLWSVYHPAFVLRDRKQIHTASLHLNLISSYLRGLSPLPSHPAVIPCRPPVSTSPATTPEQCRTSPSGA